MFESLTELAAKLEEAQHVLDPVELKTVFLACRMEKPILLEGPPGCGKTALGNAIATAGATTMVRLQCYPGITADKAIGQFDAALQELFLKTRSESCAGDNSWDALCHRLHSMEFFSPGPLMQAIVSTRRLVLLIDEVDKVDDAFEAFLLEVLSEWQLSVPKLGTIRHATKPVVILTSNESRRLGDPLRRRSLFLRVDYPSIAREAKILSLRSTASDAALRRLIAGFAQALRAWRMEKPPSIAEIVELEHALVLLGINEITAAMRDELLPLIAKTHRDRERLRMSNGFESLIADANRYALSVGEQEVAA